MQSKNTGHAVHRPLKAFTSFLTMQVPGRVGDAAVPGGGAYALKGVGGCASTGDGDLHLRFMPCYQAHPLPCTLLTYTT